MGTNMVFDESLITRHSNLEANDSLSIYNGRASQQHHNVYKTFFSVLNETNPKQILEIGTALGGFTGFLNEVMKSIGNNCRIKSYDIHNNSAYEELRKEGVDIRIQNIFENPTIPDDVIDFIRSDGLTMVLCDGGNKKHEFSILSEYIKIDDIIMTHDYARDIDHFNEHINRKVWNWCEITQDDILPFIEKYRLAPFMRDVMESVAWGSFKKIL